MIDRFPVDDEYYTSHKEVRDEEDRVELDVRILGWRKKMRIRALSFAQMEKITRLATITETDKDEGRIAGEIDQEEWVYWTIKEAVVIPHFTIVQARELADNNGTFVRELADEIWNLGRISKRQWDAYIEEQKRLNKIEKTGNPDADEEQTDKEV